MKTLAFSEADGVICLSWAKEIEHRPRKQQSPASDTPTNVFTRPPLTGSLECLGENPGMRIQVLSAPDDNCQRFTRIGGGGRGLKLLLLLVGAGRGCKPCASRMRFPQRLTLGFIVQDLWHD